MADQGRATNLRNIDRGWATSESELYANHPFHGAIFRVQNGQKVYLQYVSKEDRLTLKEWLDHKGISQGSFLIESKNEKGQDVTIECISVA